MSAVRPKRKTRNRLVPVIGSNILVLVLSRLFQEQPTTTQQQTTTTQRQTTTTTQRQTTTTATQSTAGTPTTGGG